METYDFVITVFAFSPRYSKIAKDRRIFGSREFYKKIMSCPKEFLKKMRILHPIHGDSPALDEALGLLNYNGILKTCSPGGGYIWDFPVTPREYFDTHIRPQLKGGEFSEIENIVGSID